MRIGLTGVKNIRDGGMSASFVVYRMEGDWSCGQSGLISERWSDMFLKAAARDDSLSGHLMGSISDPQKRPCTYLIFECSVLGCGDFVLSAKYPSVSP